MRIGSIQLRNRPLFLAPMEDVSDPPFRILCRRYGADCVITEFVSVEGLIRNVPEAIKKLDLFAEERPVGVQIFGSDLESMIEALRIIERYEPDFIDINYGCPVKKITCKGAGAAILKDVDKMYRLTRTIVASTHLPVTVKTRLGWDEASIRIVEVALRLQDAGIKALTIHGRTRAQMYKGSANWEYIAQVKHHPDIEIPIIGNGDVDSPEKAKACFETYSVDGIMIGRGAIGNPWIFREIRHYMETGELLPPPSLQERVEVCREHLLRSVEWKGERLALLEMRRHYGNYFKGFPGIKSHRIKLMTAEKLSDVLYVLEEIAGLEKEGMEIPLPNFS
jgi:nifR3 family TIM-barrel protein